MNDPFAATAYVEIPCGGGRLVVRRADLDFARAAIAEAGSLYRYAARHPDARSLRGRGTLYGLPLPAGGEWIVRRLGHGGLLTPLTRDRFLRVGLPRPFNELQLALALPLRGVDTPAVAAAVVYPHGVWYRGEVAREAIPGARDLAACLFSESGYTHAGAASHLAAAGALVARLHTAGLDHPDLNLRNILAVESGGRVRAYIIDLEKCRLRPSLSARRRRRMLDRLRHSVRRFEERTGRRLEPALWEAFTGAYTRGGHVLR